MVGTLNFITTNKAECREPFKKLNLEKVEKSKVMAFKFQNPPKIKHMTGLLEGVVMPK